MPQLRHLTDHIFRKTLMSWSLGMHIEILSIQCIFSVKISADSPAVYLDNNIHCRLTTRYHENNCIRMFYQGTARFKFGFRRSSLFNV